MSRAGVDQPYLPTDRLYRRRLDCERCSGKIDSGLYRLMGVPRHSRFAVKALIFALCRAEPSRGTRKALTCSPFSGR